VPTLSPTARRPLLPLLHENGVGLRNGWNGSETLDWAGLRFRLPNLLHEASFWRRLMPILQEAHGGLLPCCPAALCAVV
jgi:hypothetical protein